MPSSLQVQGQVFLWGGRVSDGDPSSDRGDQDPVPSQPSYEGKNAWKGAWLMQVKPRPYFLFMVYSKGPQIQAWGAVVLHDFWKTSSRPAL